MIPMYVGEIAEPQLRGQLGAVFQMAVITGDLKQNFGLAPTQLCWIIAMLKLVKTLKGPCSFWCTILMCNQKFV